MDEEDKNWSEAIEHIKLKDLSEKAMNSVGFVVVEEDGLIVKKFKDGRKEFIKKLENLSRNLKLD